MFINKILFNIFAIICFCYLVHADESAECDCDILQIYSEDDPNKYYNFTKQWDKQGENYFSWTLYQDAIILGNKIENGLILKLRWFK